MSARVWEVYPAIDLRRGRVVRLRQGDPDRETAYGDDPLVAARRWQEAGARWIHVINLDGALGEGGAENVRALRCVVEGTEGLRVQFGGGLRDLTAVRSVLEMGVERVILGTAAVRDPDLVQGALDVFGAKRVVVGVDARGGRVQTHGWQEASEMDALALTRRWAERGIRWVIVTDVARDGMGSGLNLKQAKRLAAVPGVDVIGAGGVGSVEDVREAYNAELSGVIIGRALYEGEVELGEALAVGG